MAGVNSTLTTKAGPVSLRLSVYPWHVHLEYLGTPAALIACGALTRRMWRTRVRPAKHGEMISIRRAATKRQPDRVRVTRACTTAEQAMSMPGVREALPQGISICRKHEEPTLYVGECRLCEPHTHRKLTNDLKGVPVRDLIAKGEVCIRSRHIGRFRLLTSWATFSNVIWIDWHERRGDAILARAEKPRRRSRSATIVQLRECASQLRAQP